MGESVTLELKNSHEDLKMRLPGILLIFYAVIRLVELYYSEIIYYIINDDMSTFYKVYVELPILMVLEIILPTIFCIVSIIAGAVMIKKNYVAMLISFGVMSIYPLIYIFRNVSELVYDIFYYSGEETGFFFTIKSVLEFVVNITLFAIIILSIICLVRTKHSKSIKRIWLIPGMVSIVHLVLTLVDIFANAMLCFFVYIFIVALCESNDMIEIFNGVIAILKFVLPYTLKCIPHILLPIFCFSFGKALKNHNLPK